MGKRNEFNSERARQMVAQEAARLIVDQGIRDYRQAKQKAAERLGFNNRGSLPGNIEIEQAVAEHLKLFAGEEHQQLLQNMRACALVVMQMLASFSPRLVGPVLAGTADGNSAVNLHVFSDPQELVGFHLGDMNIAYKPYERRLKSSRHNVETYFGYEFRRDENIVQATVFPYDGLRQAPISPINGKPMQRADERAVQALLADSSSALVY